MSARKKKRTTFCNNYVAIPGFRKLQNIRRIVPALRRQQEFLENREFDAQDHNNSRTSEQESPLESKVACSQEYLDDSWDTNQIEAQRTEICSETEAPLIESHEDRLLGSETDVVGHNLIQEGEISVIENIGDQNDEIATIEKIQQKHVGTYLNGASGLTHYELYNILLTLYVKHNMTYKLALDMIKVINFTASAENPVPESKYLFLKIASNSENLFQKIFFCTECEEVIGPSIDGNLICESCECLSKEYFITFEIKGMLEKIIDKNYDDIISYKAKLQSNRFLDDIQKGDVIQSYCGRFFSIIFNTDGVSACNTVQKSFWPILVVLNDLPPRQRFLRKNCILAGLWLSDKKPVFEVFLKPFIQELNELFNTGISIKGEMVKVICVANCVDSDARYMILNMQRFNGAHGCTICYQKGVSTVVGVTKIKDKNNPNTVKIIENKMIRFHYKNGINYREREKTEEYAKQAMEKNEPIKGVKGKTILMDIPFFDPCLCSPVDVMHEAFLGITKKFLSLWFDTSGHNQYYNGSRSQILKILDLRMLGIQTISECPREPRQLSGFNSYVANELMFFLFYHSAIFIEIMQENIMEHFQTFRLSIMRLISSTIRTAELDRIENDLSEFVKQFEEIYGQKNMIYNVHLIRHLVKTVRNFGPLWTVSLFCFEALNGMLRAFKPSPKNQLIQLAKRYQLYFNAHYGSLSVNLSDDTRKICDELFQPRKLFERKPNKNYIILYSNIMNDDNLDYYNQYFIKHVLFSTKSYSKSKKCNDSFIKLNESFFQILQILKDKTTGHLTFLLQFLVIKEIHHTNIFEYEELSNETTLKTIDDCSSILKCINISVNSNVTDTLRHFLIPVEFYLFND